MIDVSPAFVVTLFVYMVTGNFKVAVVAYLSAFIHEISHVLTARLFGCYVKKISFLACGFNAQFKNLNKVSCEKELIIAISGPLTNLLLSLLSLYLPIDYNLKIIISKINIYMLAINLLPVYPLDGGRVVYAFIKNEITQVKADKLINMVSVCVSLLVLISGIVCVFLWQKNISLLIVSLYIISNLSFEKHQVKCDDDIKTIKKMKIFCCHKDCGFGDIILKTGINRNIFVFVVDKNEYICGYITGVDLKNAAFENRYGENITPYIKEITNGGIFNGN